ncbi:c-type cytochrome [Pseudomonas mangiferae]|uniref:Cytochrome c5 family protein n=1 Tax=Pseudomonas mangiferae TaxID=2593654 RepID=A0A553GYF8_9PSED|nr:c-type cytochrome [Pseudomonas mangiferae]TRX74519.1 cytochrome c5 family protein [Pseudomonas mangiferae]
MKRMLFAAGCAALAFGVEAAQDPEAVFERACGVCHDGQLPTAPKKGDQAAWAARMDKGIDTLVLSVTNGVAAMPPRGMCTDCTAEDYQAVIRWMAK